MPIIFVKKPFPFAVDGNQVIEILAGAQGVSDRCGLGPAELDLASKAQKDADIETDPMKMTVPKLKEWLTAEGITFAADANKATLQALVPANA